MNKKEFKFVIVGGGSAGWITALYINNIFPESAVTVIESSDIGILGAGEGTTPHFVDFLNDVKININEFIKETKATVKQGIKFTNWHGDGSYYFHPFHDGSFDLQNDENIVHLLERLGDEKSTSDICLSDLCSQNSKVKFFNENNIIQNEGTYALHFDARLTAEYLKRVGLSRGIKLFDNIVVSFQQKENGNIESISLNDGSKILSDFIFDCTGFKRLILGDLLKGEWVNYQTSLPVNRALPFFLENTTEDIPPYTEAIAMKYGWIWKIPVQGRFGCGYVFDSSYATDEEIEKEIKSYFGDITIPRFFSFQAGCYKETWKNNVISLGLSSGFLEPLEATSIWVTINSLNHLKEKCLPGIFSDLNNYKNNYNSYVYNFNSQIKDFIQFHYLTKRNDSSFWKEYRTKNILSHKFKKLLTLGTADEIYCYLKDRLFFHFNSGIHVFAGVKYCDSKIFKQHVEQLKVINSFDYNHNFLNLKKQVSEFSNLKSIYHHSLLQLANNA